MDEGLKNYLELKKKQQQPLRKVITGAIDLHSNSQPWDWGELGRVIFVPPPEHREPMLDLYTAIGLVIGFMEKCGLTDDIFIPHDIDAAIDYLRDWLLDCEEYRE